MGTYNTAVYRSQGGDELVFADGTFTITGTCQVTPTRGSDAYEYGFKIDSDTMFTGEAAKKSYMVYIGGDRTADYAATGDSNDALLRMDHSNRAVNDTNFVMRGINLSVANRASGVLNRLDAAAFTARQRGDSGAMSNLCGVYVDTIVNVGAGAVGTSVFGAEFTLQLEANMPTYSAGLMIENRTDGVYTLPTAGIMIQNRGTSGCKGFTYGLDFYDASAATCDRAEIRMMTADAGSLPCIIATGTATNDAGIVADVGADSLYADGSLYISVVDSAGTLWQKRNDVWTSI